MRLVLLLFFIFTFLASLRAEINPFYKEVMQRGYSIAPGDSVILPNGRICSIEEFNNGICGKEFYNKSYCVEKGNAVWDENMCCEGLAYYLDENTAGQATCQPAEAEWFSAKWITYFFIGLLIPFIWFIVVSYNTKKKLKEQ